MAPRVSAQAAGYGEVQDSGTHTETEPQSGVTDLRSRILAVATVLFAEKGYRGTSIRRVAEEAGCTKPALYYHFRNKEALFLEILRMHVENYTARVEEAFAGEGSPVERLERGIEAFASYLEENPAPMRLIFRARRQPEPGQPLLDVTFGYDPMAPALGIVREAKATGEIRPDARSEDVMLAIVGMVDQALALFVYRGTRLPGGFARRVMDVVLRGVGT